MNDQFQSPPAPGASHCPVCHTPLPAGAPRGLCPRCLLEGAAAPDDTAPAAPHSHHPPGVDQIAAAFPQFEILGLIGAGGMGAVYKARQRHLDRVVALKVLPESLAARPAFAERFNREARVLARLNHPNIVTVHDFGQCGGFFFLLMEYVDGVNLRQAMRAGRFTPSQALDLVPRLCEALQFAHDEGILHRDIKPENILLDTRGRVKIADFGIAKLVGDASPDITLTASGAALGTPAYMAPEQIEKPADVDHRADIYSLGVVLYEMLTGELPLGRFAPPSEKTPVDRRVDDLVFRALEKEREKRFQSATEVRTRVESLGQSATPASPVPAAAPAPAALEPAIAQPDFVVCHPALPRMAKALTVYGLIISPALFLFALVTIESTQHANPYAQVAQHLTDGVTLLGDFVATGLFFLGAWKLRALRPSAPRILCLGIWLHFATLVLALLGIVWIEQLAPTPDPTSPPTSTQAIELVVAFGILAFELTALAWLYHHRDSLQAAMARGRHPGTAGTPAPAVFGPPPATVRHATFAAVLTTASLALGLPALSSLGLWLVALNQDPRTGALGPVELGTVLTLGALIAVLGAVGILAGLRALHAVRAAGTALYGTRRAILGALGWPLAATAIATEMATGRLFLRVCENPLLAALLTLVVALGSTELLLRAAWRWLCRSRPGQPAAPQPGWTHGLAAALVIATAIALVPPAAVSLGNSLRADLPPMVVTLEGDPGLPTGVATNHSTMQISVGCPPRTILRVQTSLLRNDQIMRSPLSEFHLVNPRLSQATHPLLTRILDRDAAGPEWQLVANSDLKTHTYSYRADETTGVRWAPVGPPPSDPLRVGQTTDFEILRGPGPDGATWSVRLIVASDPLVPAVDVGEHTLVGPGNNWSASVKAAGLDPDAR